MSTISQLIFTGDTAQKFTEEYRAFDTDSGLPREDVNLKIREIYNAGQAKGENYAITKANMLAFALDNLRLQVYDFDPFANAMERQVLCGDNRSALWDIVWERMDGVAHEKYPGLAEKHYRGFKTGLSISQLDLSHTSPDWDAVLTLGVPGMLRRAEEAFAAKPCPFTEAVVIVYRAWQRLVRRWSALAMRRGLRELGETLHFLVENPPKTFRQALQLGLLYREFQEIDCVWVRSLGIFDRCYNRFYQQDLADGRLTEESAEELLCYYFARFSQQSHGLDNAGTPFCFGGQLPNSDEDGCNALTRLSWKAFRRLGYVDPKFSLRVNEKTPDDILLQIADCLKEGKTATVFANEAVARKMFLRNGKDAEDLCNFIPIGCYEPAIMGKELSCTMSALFNFAKIGTMIFSDLPDFTPVTFEDVLEKYLELMDVALRNTLEEVKCWEQLWNDINPSPVISGTMNECMSRCLDVSQYGTKYSTSGIMCAGIGTATDTLAAINELVFARKKVSWSELRDILAANWDGHEQLRLFAKKRPPKWGTGNEFADSIAKTIVDRAADIIESTPNTKGGRFLMGLWSINWSMRFGAVTPATADGRLNGAPISKNTGSTIGCDKEGIAGLMQSVTKLDHSRFGDGAVLDVMLAPRTVAGPDGSSFIVNLIRTFFRMGGFFVHFNILSPETLRAAQETPEKYQNLQIRLCGWNVRFIDLDRPMQDCLIQEAESKA